MRTNCEILMDATEYCQHAVSCESCPLYATHQAEFDVCDIVSYMQEAQTKIATQILINLYNHFSNADFVNPQVLEDIKQIAEKYKVVIL